jgi:hypothetical protein
MTQKEQDQDSEAPVLTEPELAAKIFKLKRYMSLLEGKIRKRELDVHLIKTKHVDDKKMVEMGVRLLDPNSGKGVHS